ncbi:putative OST3 / OST6 family, transporter family [Monocercomonoides exilis]|uniref:putative OST3 / OST6 family, transporter family n=1 Tax=Monocercomonoides exilis TaxID=2049356 RepID=UPI0035596DE8|nr:putative OST3 / OST6 family, transporter family [Monocercomonoides exilis]|eukprot:MONOS_9006.1-p1 / transcript=MONOS_9006.1 / gene=MONOS_9006 / organism=Monocercomonoides_exilis_PA203 / gene_product=unspecified product / transcript_product=unspecified product / location=Mono_scaffold00357:12445-13979(+) / protein_length=329 / sequence_SO=supercontig / SO=protein_coding / is_pseudo=false
MKYYLIKFIIFISLSLCVPHESSILRRKLQKKQNLNGDKIIDLSIEEFKELVVFGPRDFYAFCCFVGDSTTCPHCKVFDPMIMLIGTSVAHSNRIANSSIPVFPIRVVFSSQVENIQLIGKIGLTSLPSFAIFPPTERVIGSLNEIRALPKKFIYHSKTDEFQLPHFRHWIQKRTDIPIFLITPSSEDENGLASKFRVTPFIFMVLLIMVGALGLIGWVLWQSWKWVSIFFIGCVIISLYSLGGTAYHRITGTPFVIDNGRNGYSYFITKMGIHQQLGSESIFIACIFLFFALSYVMDTSTDQKSFTHFLLITIELSCAIVLFVMEIMK